MFSGMLDTAHLPEVVFRTALVYLSVLVALRLAGKREVGQMKPFDLVTLLILSNAVQNAMVGPDNSLVGGLVAAGVILLLNFLVGMLRERSGLAGRMFEGSPTLLVHEGQMIPDHLRYEHLTEADVLQALREHGIEELHRVQTAVLEVDGTISVIPRDETRVTRTRRHIRRRQQP